MYKAVNPKAWFARFQSFNIADGAHEKALSDLL